MKRKKKQKLTPTNKHIKIDNEMIENEEWLTIADIVAHLKVSRSTILRMRKRQEIPDIKICNTPMFPKYFINKLLLINGLKSLEK